ncbi:MAG TPA: potassium channel family protein [Terriglobales bacterium]|nr:potassium channel family protein [Terriglobales bacterium]
MQREIALQRPKPQFLRTTNLIPFPRPVYLTMHSLAIIAGIVIISIVLLDAFETVVLPRRVQRHFRITILFYRNTWGPYAKLASRIKSQTRRETVLGYFGPLSMIALLVIWALGLILGFALLQYGGGDHLAAGNQPITFGLLLYHSGETFFTLGYGDVTPASYYSRALSVCEAGMGFAFLAVVIGYLPTIYSAFSRREIEISLLDARAGSPPSAAELLTRTLSSVDRGTLDRLLHDWERWAAEVLESHLSYPVLSFYRSQHSNQSWLGALTVILDATALVIAGIDGVSSEQARWTYKMARHAVVDLAQVVNAHYDPMQQERLSEGDLAQMRALLAEKGLKLGEGAVVEAKLHELRMKYEPYVMGIARNLYIPLPPWIRHDTIKDNWQAGPWDRMIQAQALGRVSREHQAGEKTAIAEDHF